MPCRAPYRPPPLALAVVAALVVAVDPALAGAAPASAQPGRILWGAYVDGDAYGLGDPPWDLRALARFEERAGRRVAILHFGQAWYRDGRPQAFPERELARLERRGAVGLVDWSSWDAARGGSTEQPALRLRTIIAGRHDATIRSWARAARRHRHRILLRFDHEMNGAWFPWSEQRNGNRPGEFRRAWRHVRRIFRAEGARNVRWVWSPNVLHAAGTPLRGLYPGDAAVDWVAVDGYNWGTLPGRHSTWRPFVDIFGPTYRALRRLAPSKPVMIAEVASTEHGGSKARWIRAALRAAPVRFPAVRALVWFDWGVDGLDWPIDSSRASASAFREGIAGRAYVGPDWPPPRLANRARERRPGGHPVPFAFAGAKAKRLWPAVVSGANER